MRTVLLPVAGLLTRLSLMTFNGFNREVDSAQEPAVLAVQCVVLILAGILLSRSESLLARSSILLVTWGGGALLATAVLMKTQPQSLLVTSLLFQVAEIAPAMIVMFVLGVAVSRVRMKRTRENADDDEIRTAT